MAGKGETVSTPILSKKFFEQHSPDSGFFSKWRDLAPWSDKCLPIYEWDGVLFIACLYPPADFPKLTSKPVFVLCDPESLKSVWYEYQGTLVGKSAPLKPAPLKMDDIPEGLSANVSVKSAPEALSMDSLAGDLNIPNTTSSDENLLQDSSEENVLSESAEESDSLDLDIAIPNAAPAASLPSTPPPTFQPAATVAASLEAKPLAATKPPTAKASVEKENPYTKPGALSSKKDLGENLEVTRISVNALQSTPKGNLDSFMQTIFTEMEYHFEKSMVFLKDGEEMKPWRWDGNFQMNSDEDSSPNGVQLESASPWRIVMSTQKPYHGYVTPNEINDKFFDAWNNAQAPAHMTLVPVMIEDHVIGMLLGLGEKSADNKNSLQLAEKLAADISQQIRSQPEFLKASS